MSTPTDPPADQPVVQIPPPRRFGIDAVTIPEIADLHVPPVKIATVEQWRARLRSGKCPFPEEDDTFGPHPVWRPARIRAWFEATGRPYDEKLWRKKRKAGGYRRPVAREAAARRAAS